MDFSYEQKLQTDGFKLIAGVDEAGRGPLAGPVVAAAVIFDFQEVPAELSAVTDSKKLSANKRISFAKIIMERASGYGIGVCDHTTIDRINILQATFLAIKKALSVLKTKPQIILVDGQLPLPNYSSPQQAIINGDNLVFSIAAASIIAKVTRDAMMEQMHAQYPRYFFNRHKGYGTKLHLDALKLYGPCEIHRKSFKPIKNFY
ncbi:ribonuclease HII [Candidatus Falkowbacteria bacterium RIFCSPLOWO2_02_FULL_45_15]|uniref:Ribonuclease HII n=2 Tax=Candidatus Falkowiibacteriota TaxID=1752728 RepID=A0A1F5RYJ3_9BACT|nr:MAG: ribonuclease HII [Candidatus Falkowbacteria bacterium RIFCSPHIGHO2_02_FULL_45_15]OGF19521.1 MAG: ribonuclease HII [Candidatus Falkowbacteria bacterium RIFCSPLOWO2_02_FULL_45_15]